MLSLLLSCKLKSCLTFIVILISIAFRIEHVYPNILEAIPFHIFGIVKPKIAVFTTPNGEFNVMFDMKPGAFRHDDHKFEWTRAEFEDWCNHICARFPDYCVQFHGIAVPPDEVKEDIGCCSQLGLFLRKDFLESLDKDEFEERIADEVVPKEELIECEGYKLIHEVQYPFFHDCRSRDQKILDECSYHINRYRWMEDLYYNYEADRFEIPLTVVANACWEITDDIEEIREIVERSFELQNDFIILPPNEIEEEETDE